MKKLVLLFVVSIPAMVFAQARAIDVLNIVLKKNLDALKAATLLEKLKK